MSKYPRTPHLPWSEGSTNDDKKLSSVAHFISSKTYIREIVITEKLDGSNACLKKDGVFARTHSKIATHPSFNLLKSKYAGISHLMKDDEKIFGENCFAVHSIIYEELSDVFFVFGIEDNGLWLSYDNLLLRAKELDLSTVPLLFRGYVSSEKELESLCSKFMKEKSIFGGDREGLVIRIADSFDIFENAIAKQVRKNHVQTDDHWMFQTIKPQKTKKERC